MNYVNSSATAVKETIRSFFSVNRSLAGSISKWVSSATINSLLQTNLFNTITDNKNTQVQNQ